jgi:hypothetical protein
MFVAVADLFNGKPDKISKEADTALFSTSYLLSLSLLKKAEVEYAQQIEARYRIWVKEKQGGQSAR